MCNCTLALQTPNPSQYRVNLQREFKPWLIGYKDTFKQIKSEQVSHSTQSNPGPRLRLHGTLFFPQAAHAYLLAVPQ